MQAGSAPFKEESKFIQIATGSIFKHIDFINRRHIDTPPQRRIFDFFLFHFFLGFNNGFIPRNAVNKIQHGNKNK